MTVDAPSIVEVSELEQDQWRMLQSMRLAALENAPDAFITPAAAEQRMSDADWRSRFTASTWLVARDGGEPVGIACLAPPEPDAPDVHYVESVWVRPGYRGRGVLRQMVDELEHRARGAGATTLRLWVLDTNEGASLAYHKLGFSPELDVEQDTVKPIGRGTFVKERPMSKPLFRP